MDQILSYNGSTIPLDNPVEQLSSNYFVVMVNGDIDANLLETLLVNEFKARNLDVVFEYGIFNCVDENMVYGNTISLIENKEAKQSNVELPKWEDNDYYFGVMFTNKQSTLLDQMRIWIFSSVVLLIVVLFFAYALFIILKQRKFTETQKQFINNMTHEFRTPISTIQLSSAVLKDPEIVKDAERLNTYANIIKEESEKLLHQVENVLQVAIIEDKKLKLKMELLNVHEIIEDLFNIEQILSPNDEFANYETWDQGNLDLSEAKTDDMLQYEYAREALKSGLALEESLGTNPFKLGLVGSTDAHTALATTEEDNFFGKHTGKEPSDHRWSTPVLATPAGDVMGWEQAAETSGNDQQLLPSHHQSGQIECAESW